MYVRVFTYEIDGDSAWGVLNNNWFLDYLTEVCKLRELRSVESQYDSKLCVWKRKACGLF
jgi:hypothetical protein